MTTMTHLSRPLILFKLWKVPTSSIKIWKHYALSRFSIAGRLWRSSGMVRSRNKPLHASRHRLLWERVRVDGSGSQHRYCLPFGVYKENHQ
ncbi:unnamed protein product, partial [Nesidiocoris tenuis]